MDRMQNLQEKTKKNLERIHDRQLNEIIALRDEGMRNLEMATTVKEAKKRSEKYTKELTELNRRHHEELQKLHEEYVKSLLSL